MSIEAIFKFVATTVPGLLILGGVLLLALGYPINNTDMIRGGWGLIILGGGLYILELFIYAYLES